MRLFVKPIRPERYDQVAAMRNEALRRNIAVSYQDMDYAWSEWSERRHAEWWTVWTAEQVVQAIVENLEEQR